MSLLKLRFAMLATMTLLFGFLAGIFGLIVWYYGATLESNLMLTGIVAFVVLLTAVQWWAGPWLIKVTTRMRELKPNEYPELHEMLAELSRKAGIKKPRLFLVMDGTPNAFAFGRTPNDSNVAVHSGLLGVLNKEEVKAVLAHEVGHVKHWDVAVITLASMVPLLAYYLIVLFFSRQSNDRGAPSGIAVFFGALLAQFLSRLLVMYLSRTREYYADAFSAAATRKPASLANALKKISYGFAGVNPRAYESKAAFYIASPSEAAELGDKAREREIDYAIEWEKTNAWAGIGELLSTHPLTFKRLAALRELENNLPEVDAA
ncbi:MAG: zinc metalloprotease HtpX [Candidatus Micrarchaeia archaeon]